MTDLLHSAAKYTTELLIVTFNHSLLKRPGLRVAGARTTALFPVIAIDLWVYID